MRAFVRYNSRADSGLLKQLSAEILAQIEILTAVCFPSFVSKPFRGGCRNPLSKVCAGRLTLLPFQPNIAKAPLTLRKQRIRQNANASLEEATV